MSETPHGLLPGSLERWFTSLCSPLALGLASFGISADAVTLLSLGIALGAGGLIAIGYLHWALLALLAMGLCDILDGLVAKQTGTLRPFGAILDSSVDRYAEFLIFAGLGAYFFLAKESEWIFVVALALAGSYQVSYIKARAEGAGQFCPVGLFQRSERLVALSLGLLFGGWFLKIILLLLVLLAHYTAVERLVYLRRDTLN